MGDLFTLDGFKDGSKRCVKVSDDFNHEIYGVGHHRMTEEMFYSSNLESLIITMDGGGIELDGEVYLYNNLERYWN